MKKAPIFLLLAITLSIFSCTKEETADLKQLQNENLQIPADVQAKVDQAIAILEADYNNPPTEDEVTTRSIVYVPDGSVDALADAIAAAGPNGKVVLENGDHWESSTVMITHKMTLAGEEGAKLYVDGTAPGDPSPYDNVLTPAIYVKDCNNVWIKNLEIIPTEGNGSTGLFLENAKNARIEDNTINHFQYGIWVSENSDNARMYDNAVDGSNAAGIWGVTIESGRNAKLKGNHVSQYAVCIFTSDEKGIVMENTTMTTGFTGFLLCTVQGNILLPDGSVLENAIPCKDWLYTKNKSYDSIWNYIVIDGANNNTLIHNESYNPSSGVDMFLLGESMLVGVPTPTSYENFVLNFEGFVATDCGLDNIISGGTVLDGPCF